ncbi:MAG: glutamine amidotransferase family protein [Actinomycetota bacterium]|nr:glutamine amidotransferase family protein [Actinomycetota bacterium]
MNLNLKYKSGYRVPSGCAVFGVINESGRVFNGEMVINAISMMHDRSNGLGGGFAAYGIYPEFKDYYALHLFFDDSLARKETEVFFQKVFKIKYAEDIETGKNNNIKNPPIIARYFVVPKNIITVSEELKELDINNESDYKSAEEEFMARFVTDFNYGSNNAFIISSGKNMGVFKGVGYPEDIGHFYKLDNYKGYLWTSHGRFPTNSTGWWGGAHPFGFLNWSVVHNGEISSYGTNKRFVNDYGYKCSFSTDTEVLTYLFDLLVRKHNISIYLINYILASPLWSDIELFPEEIRDIFKTLRIIYSRALVNGPFSIIVGNQDYMYALNDRIKLRPLVAAKNKDYSFVSSEESSIRKVCPSPDRVWFPDGGEPVLFLLNKKGKKPEIEHSPVEYLNEYFSSNMCKDKQKVV